MLLLLSAACGTTPAAPSSTAANKPPPAAATTPPSSSLAGSPARTPAVSTSPTTPVSAPAATPYQAGPPLNPRVKVTLADIQSTSDGGFYLALDKGYFEAEGLDVELVRFDTATAQVSALGTGQLDVGVGALSAGLLNAVGRGIPIEIVADRATLKNGALSFLVRKELIDSGQITSWADLRGRSVANNGNGTAAQLALRRGLATAGLTLQDIDQQLLPFPDMVAALGSGSIDMAVIIEPLASAAIGRGFAVRWQRAMDVFPDLEISIVTYADAFARNTEAANRFMIAYLRGVREYHDGLFKGLPNRAEVVQALIDHTAIKDPAVYDRIEQSYVNPNGHVLPSNLKEQQREFGELGLLEGPPVDLDRVIDMSYVEHALRVLGPYQE